MKNLITVLLYILLLLSMPTSQALTLSDEKLTVEQIEQGVEDLIDVLEKNYIYPKKTLLIKNKLREQLAKNEFNNVNDWYSFIRQANVVIRGVSGDMFLDIVETNSQFILEKGQLDSDSKERFGIDKVSILSSNIGYFRLNHFYQNPQAEVEISNTLNTLSKVDALIIDLRNSEGESISLAQYIMSFFVDEGTILSEILYDKKSKRKLLKATKNNVNDKFKDNFPIYILTSSFISSSGEFLSYTLKHLGKAVIVGEETMGVAYVLKKQKINNYISMNIPIAIPFHPKTNTNWSFTGVIPDIETSAKLSLDEAHKKAKSYLGRF